MKVTIPYYVLPYTILNDDNDMTVSVGWFSELMVKATASESRWSEV
jgi:hypothetical protein